MWNRTIPALALTILACSPAQEPAEPARPADVAKTEGAERIDQRNDPSLFRLQMVRRFVDLPTLGESTRKPFPSNWWPMSQGGAARSWYQNEASPTEKYDQLVHPDQIADVELTLAQKNWKDEPVNEGAEPETFHVGPATEWELREHGRYGDVDPDSWWGHCNGWASYVLNEDEPIREVWVRMNGSDVEECHGDTTGCVAFRLGDINALGAELYWSDAARMLGRRCEQESSEFEFDEAGRINNVYCRDGNAGAWHIIATNMLGVMQRPFILDLSANFEVWNYPVYRFELTRNDDLTLEEALAEVGAPEGTTTWIYNEDAVSFRRIQMRAWIVEDAIPPSNQPAGDELSRYTTLETYDYVLELDAAGDIVGGEWVGRSKTNHADFVWYSYSNDRYGADDRWDGDNPHVRYSVFKQILTLAQNTPEPPPAGDVLRLSSQPGLSIPDQDPNGASDTITVDESFAATSVKVTLDVTHTYRGDLTVLLSHGDRQLTLRAPSGGSQHDLHESYTVDGTGLDAAGDWTLTIVDAWAQDTGTIDAWTLELTRPAGGGGGGGSTTVTKRYDATPSLAIPDNDQTGIISTIRIDDDIQISDLTVTVDVTHTWVGDLLITISNGTATQTLHDRTGGGQRDLHETYPTLAFRNASARGHWTLKVTDNAGRDVGTLDAWSIEVTGTER